MTRRVPPKLSCLAACAPSQPQGPGPSTPEELLSHVAVHRPSNVYQLLALLDTLEVALGAAEAAAAWQQQQQQQQDGMQGLEGAGATAAGPQGHFPGAAAAAPRDRRRLPHLLVVDSVSALLSTVVGSSQHTQGGRARDTDARDDLSSRLCAVSAWLAPGAGSASAELSYAYSTAAHVASATATRVLVFLPQAARCLPAWPGSLSSWRTGTPWRCWSPTM